MSELNENPVNETAPKPEAPAKPKSIGVSNTGTFGLTATSKQEDGEPVAKPDAPVVAGVEGLKWAHPVRDTLRLSELVDYHNAAIDASYAAGAASVKAEARRMISALVAERDDLRARLAAMETAGNGVDVSALVKAAVEEERERCAKLVEQSRVDVHDLKIARYVHDIVGQMTAFVASAIRAGKGGGK